MFGKVLTKVFGSQHERDIKKLQPLLHWFFAEQGAG